jgi:hypothetical protein
VRIQRDCWGEEASPARALDHAVTWLASQSPPHPLLERHTCLADALQRRLDSFFIVPSSATPHYCIALLNAIVTDLARDVRLSMEIAWPNPGELQTITHSQQCRACHQPLTFVLSIHAIISLLDHLDFNSEESDLQVGWNGIEPINALIEALQSVCAREIHICRVELSFARCS